MSELFWEGITHELPSSVSVGRATKALLGRSAFYERVKRALDLTSSGLGLLLLSPVLACWQLSLSWNPQARYSSRRHVSE